MSEKMPAIFCAIDKPDMAQAVSLCEQVSESGIGIKLGLELFNAAGPQGVAELQNQYPDLPVFLDLKYHDIPNTVAGAIRSVTQHVKPAFLNVHAAGGRAMMEAAKESCLEEVKLLAVTMLTSLDEKAIEEAGYKSGLQDRVVQMATLAKDCGLDGVVCSSHEIEILRKECGDDFVLMVPGIRPEGSAIGDQKRIMTPREAMDKGASHLVIGRPITQSDNPLHTAQEILGTLK
jgi:orotidine-5'-phosphate decarboxylase